MTPNLPIALAASSRFAAQAEAAGQEPMVSASQLEEMKEQRREWQSEVSAAAAAASEAENPGNEGAKDKLNLDEITETMTNIEARRSR